jgi:hypothetical protein
MNQNRQTEVLFYERQKFTQRWIWAFVFIATVLMWCAFLLQIFFHIQFGNNPMPNILLLIFWLFFGVGLPMLFYFANLTVEVRHDGIFYRFFPFQKSFKKITKEQLKNYEITTCRPLRDYGGWGIRYTLKGNKAYIVKGNRGVKLEFLTGKHLLIGSQRAEELYQAIQNIS